MNKIHNIITIFLFLVLSICGFSQNLKNNGKIKIILEKNIKSDSVDIILYSNNNIIKEIFNPFEENNEFKSYSLDIKSGLYDVLVQSENFPLILYKDVEVKKKKISILILDYSKIDTTNMWLQLREFRKKIEFSAK